MKPIESDTNQNASTPSPGVGRQVLIGGLWLASVGFWLWAGVQLGQLIGALWL